MKKLVYTFGLLLMTALTSEAQNLTVQGAVTNGTLGGIANRLVSLQIHLSPVLTFNDTLFTDTLGNFSASYPVSAAQGPGTVTATTYCNNFIVTSIDSFSAPAFLSTFLFNCSGSTNPPPISIGLNGQISPTALGDSILMTLYNLSLIGTVVDTSFYVSDTMNMGHMFYGFPARSLGIYMISASSNNGSYYTTFYGNTTVQSQATLINAFNQSNYNGLNIQFQTIPSSQNNFILGSTVGFIPSFSGPDSLRAILIEVRNNIWTPLDTIVFTDSIFNFSTTNPGPYAVLVNLVNGNAANYAPTYHDNATTWTASTPFTANPNSNTIVLNVTLQPASGNGSGNGGAGGGIFNGLPFTGSVGMAGIPVQLVDDNGNLLKVRYSRADGSYNFTGLPFGNYGMRVELFGVPSTTYIFSLSNSNPTLQINFTLGTNGIAASMEEAELTVLASYPNPAKDWVRLQLKAKNGQAQTIRLRDLQGKLMLEKTIQLESGTQEIELSLTGLSQGMYLLEITGSQKSVSRLVIQ